MQRPLVTGVLVVGMAAAAAIHAGIGTGLPVSMLGDQPTVARTAAGNGGAQQPMPDPWLKQLDDDPRDAGRADALQEEGEKLCGFVGLPVAACITSANAPAPDPKSTYPAPQVMVVIAPDPIHTHLALLFDRGLDAFEDGLQDSGWQYQGYWLPWSSLTAKPDSGDLKTREQQRLFFEGREESPGVLFFRSEEGEKKLVVFVVTDSPTAGINPSQFRTAMRDLSTLAPLQKKLSIVGPSFTGALPSLHLLVGEAKSGALKDWPITIASGSVRDYRCGKWKPADDSCMDDEPIRDRFVSFGSAFYLETQETVAFLAENGGVRPEDIAILTEDESSFGDLPKMDKRSRKMLRLTFPRGISHLRSAYQKNGVWGFGGSSSNASSVSLTLDFDEPHEADDSVPSFAKEQLPVSQEGSMGQISATLEQRGIKAVLLSATDVMDELFVAQMLARQAPNVTVVVRGSDVLFLRSGDGGVYHNMYAVSPWPLIPKNHWWTRAKEDAGRARSFPSGDSEGFYNATRYLLGDPLQDYTSPIRKTTRPPLWFSAIGHGAYWPLALLTTDPSGSKVPNLPGISQGGEPQGLGDETISLSLRFAILIACGLSLLHAGKCLNWQIFQSLASARYNLGDESNRGLKLWLQLGVILLCVLILCLLGVPGAGLTVVDLWSAVPLAITVSALSVAGAHVVWKLLFEKRMVRKGHLVKQEKEPRGLLTTAIAVAFFFAACLIWMAVWRWSPFTPSHPSGAPPAFDGVPQFLSYRATYPLSGSSPILPLLLSLGGLVLALVSTLGRLNFGANLAPRLPEKVDHIRNCPNAQSMQGVTDLLVWPQERKLQLRRLLIPVLVIATSFIFVATMHLAPETLEGSYLTNTLRGVMFVVLIVLVGDLVTSVILWRQLKLHCLDPLESSPLRRGFSAISGITWKDLWLIPQSQFNQYRALLRALEQSTRKVMDGDAGAALDGGASLRTAANTMWKIIDDKEQPEVVIESFGKLQDKLAKTAAVILKELADAWREEVDRITAPDSTEDKDRIEKESEDDQRSTAERVREIREEWIALIYVHYMRLVLVQIRSRLMTAAMLYLVLAWSVTSYPYINRHALMIGLTALLGALAVVAVWTYSSINRDPILSRTTEHIPGKLDFDFYAKTASMVGIPLVGLVASQFPEITSFLFSWIEPGMSAVK